MNCLIIRIAALYYLNFLCKVLFFCFLGKFSIIQSENLGIFNKMYFSNEKLVDIGLPIINEESILYDYFCIGTCRRRHVRIKLNRTRNNSFKI